MANNEQSRKSKPENWRKLKHSRKTADETFCQEPCSICGHSQRVSMIAGNVVCNCEAQFGTHTKLYIMKLIDKL